jgi:hypothetical protein
MSGSSAAAASAASAAYATRGAAAQQPAVGAADPMDEDASEVLADAASAARIRKSAAASAAAAAACAQLAAAATGPYSQMHSSDQVLLLGDSELWDTIAENWCKPGKESIEQIVATWEGRDLAACVHRLGLPVLYAKRNYVQHMRASVVTAVRSHAAAHPELFEAPPGSSQDEDDDAVGAEQEALAAVRVAPAAPLPQAAPPSTPPRRAASPAAVVNRRSPRSPASSRSVAAMAFAALHALPRADSGPSLAASGPSAARRGVKPPVAAASLPSLAPHEAGPGGSDPDDGGDDDESDSDSDSEWLPDRADPTADAVRRGGRLSSEEMDRQLAAAGVQRSFHEGFVRNARSAAGGRSMYQLYTEVTAGFSHESSRRECLALSRILDALLRGDKVAALEHTCRRLGGVHTAAETGSWAMCERLETEAEQRSFVPDAFMRSALKSVTQMQAVKKSVGPGGATGKGGSSNKAATGRWEQRGSAARPSKKELNRDTQPGASSSFKKKGGSDPK